MHTVFCSCMLSIPHIFKEMFFAKLTQKARPLKETSVILRKILLPYSVNFYD